MQYNFNASQYAPLQPQDAMPEGWYSVIIKEVTQVPVQNKNPQFNWMAKFVIQVIEGQFQGREVINNLNLVNESAKAAEIANRELSSISHVTGKYQFQDLRELCNIPFKAFIAIREYPAKNNPSEMRKGNEITGYKDMMGNDPGKTGATGAQAAGMQQPIPPAAPPMQQPPAQQYAPPAAAPAAGPGPGQWPAPAGAPPAGAPQWPPQGQQAQPPAQQYAPPAGPAPTPAPAPGGQWPAPAAAGGPQWPAQPGQQAQPPAGPPAGYAPPPAGPAPGQWPAPAAAGGAAPSGWPAPR